MSSEGALISELVIAKENIKRKYSALKQGEVDTRSFVTQTLNPIIKPLKKIQKSFKSAATVSKSILDDRAPNGEEADNDVYFEESDFEYLDNWPEASDRDKTYGPKKVADSVYKLGDKELKFVENKIILENTSYPKTSGLIQLIFSKHPLQYTDEELDFL